MQSYKTIAVIHPGAIGDTVMGTPVAAALKRTYKQASIAYLTHPSLFALLELTGTIDCFLPFDKSASVFALAGLLKKQSPELVIDLVGSLRTRVIAALVRARTLTLSKRQDVARGLHVVDSYLQTVAPLNLDLGESPFPTLFPPPALLRELADSEGLFDRAPMVVMVPGVGKLRPNRAWPLESWVSLGRQLLEKQDMKLVLLGGVEDRELCCAINEALEARCIDVCGRLTLPLTAALLSQADVVVSADTGPAHIAVAVGAKVVGLTGPTDPLRTGPYGMSALGLHAGQHCQCRNAKRCSFTQSAGKCMETIGPADVLALVVAQLAASKRVHT